MERQDKVVLTLDSYEHGIMIRALNELRNDLLEEQRDPGPDIGRSHRRGAQPDFMVVPDERQESEAPG